MALGKTRCLGVLLTVSHKRTVSNITRLLTVLYCLYCRSFLLFELVRGVVRSWTLSRWKFWLHDYKETVSSAFSFHPVKISILWVYLFFTTFTCANTPGLCCYAKNDFYFFYYFLIFLYVYLISAKTFRFLNIFNISYLAKFRNSTLITVFSFRSSKVYKHHQRSCKQCSINLCYYSIVQLFPICYLFLCLVISRFWGKPVGRII